MNRFELYFDDHREDGLVWELKVSGTIYRAELVIFDDVYCETLYRGKDEIPSAIIFGYGCITRSLENPNVFIINGIPS